jgi:hypothetical protein
MSILTTRKDEIKMPPAHQVLAITYRTKQRNFAMYNRKAKNQHRLQPIVEKELIVLETIKFNPKPRKLSDYYRFNLAIHLLLAGT